LTPQSFKRKLSAIFMADVVGYSRLMGENEAATLKTLTAYKGVMDGLIRQHRGRMVDAPGDAVLAEFSSVVDAVQCAVAVQKELEARNAELPENSRMRFRIGINLGDVIEEGEKIYGDGVNIAARLEALAEPGGICISKTAFDHIETKLPLGYEFLGEKAVKNIARPVSAYRVLLEPRVTVAGEIGEERIRPAWPKKAVVAGALVMFLAVISLAAWKYGFFSSQPAERIASTSLQPPSTPPTKAAPSPPASPAPQTASPLKVTSLPKEASQKRAGPSPKAAPPTPTAPPAASAPPVSFASKAPAPPQTAPSPKTASPPQVTSLPKEAPQKRMAPLPKATPPTPTAPPAASSPQASPPSPAASPTPAAASPQVASLPKETPKTLAAPLPQAAPATRMGLPIQDQGTSIFKDLDKNNDGKVTLDEFMAWREMRFDLLDKNKDGSLSREEVSAGKIKFAWLLLKNFALVDQNQDQMISREEFREASKLRFFRMDKNRDGHLTQHEMAEAKFGQE
jgi:adenylate cyclase